MTRANAKAVLTSKGPRHLECFQKKICNAAETGQAGKRHAQDKLFGLLLTFVTPYGTAMQNQP